MEKRRMNLPTGPDTLCFDKDEFMKEAGAAGGAERRPGAVLQAAEDGHGGAHQQGLRRLCQPLNKPGWHGQSPQPTFCAFGTVTRRGSES
uniref:Component of oligomeric golgi complex 2 n=1 Tax=Mus musculus TaxID=10090 RepID=H3BL04_MOUSE